MNNFLPTEVFLRLPDRSKNDRRLKQSVRRSQFLVTEVTAARLTTHRRVFAPGATDYFATGVTEELFSSDRSVFAIARPKQKWPSTEAKCPPIAISCDWGDSSTINYPPKSFHAGRDRLLCDWRDWWIIFCRPKCFCDCPTEAKMTVDWSKVSANRNFLWLRWPQHN